ncbi:hypothetical protein ANN_15064 [Periplaneta americana]|uniref:Uncharacterized protein n=1 Tax=Periplaneta americana TaxID=6978 RepID=A0ABQ8SY22_PERAM|nr:hypothetical protein ANN_15064 [Periplaneta americana]
MAGLCEGGNEPPGSLKASNVNSSFRGSDTRLFRAPENVERVRTAVARIPILRQSLLLNIPRTIFRRIARLGINNLPFNKMLPRRIPQEKA